MRQGTRKSMGSQPLTVSSVGAVSCPENPRIWSELQFIYPNLIGLEDYARPAVFFCLPRTML